MYWRDINEKDCVQRHMSERDGLPYHTVNNGPVHWLQGEREEAIKALDRWADTDRLAREFIERGVLGS